MNTGLSASEWQLIIDALNCANAERAILFGSRAKGGWKSNSDIDIAISGANVNIATLREHLDELPLPYKFDILDYNKISNPDLRDHINRIGINIPLTKSVS
jgi:predicted nucleotidyltransferase